MIAGDSKAPYEFGGYEGERSVALRIYLVPVCGLAVGLALIAAVELL